VSNVKGLADYGLSSLGIVGIDAFRGFELHLHLLRSSCINGAQRKWQYYALNSRRSEFKTVSTVILYSDVTAQGPIDHLVVPTLGSHVSCPSHPLQHLPGYAHLNKET
jgi:hypothetical protein